MLQRSWIRAFVLPATFCLAAAVFAPAPAHAGFLAVLDVPGIPGESVTPLPDQIEVLSYSLGVSPLPTKATSSCGGKRGALANTISITKRIDKASPKLFVAAVLGTVFPTVTLRVFRPDPLFNYLTVTLTNAVVASIKNGGAGSDSDQPREDVSFSYAAIQISYSKPDGVPADATNASWTVCEKAL